MTNNDANVNPPAMIAALDQIIAAINNADEFDVFENFESFRAILPPAAFEYFALSFDACPIHLCDLDSCADDDSLDIAREGRESDLTLCRRFREPRI